MQQRLSDRVHLAAVGDDLVFLDLERDAYLCVPHGVAGLRPAPDGRSLAPLTPEAAERLIEAGLLVPAGPAAAPAVRPKLALPTRGLPPGDHGLRLRDGLNMAGALWDLATRYPGRDLAGVIASASAAPRAHGAREAETLRLAGLFGRLAIWLPIPGKCVVRSFLLLRFLQRSGCGAAWVFGVRTWPFGAHCWLQLGDVALDDAPERLRTFEPILAVGP